MPSRGELREAEGRGAAPGIREAAEALRGYQRWEFHPSKQYVRRHGWLQPIKLFLQSRAQVGVNTRLKYLTLPGKDAVDVGLLHREGLLPCIDGRWPGLAICDSEHATAVVGKIGQPDLGWAPKRIEQVLFNPDHKVTRSFPFDVVNLDYCGPLFVELPNWRLHGRVATLGRICALQKRSAFLLLLTTQDSEHKIDPRARERMVEYLSWNLRRDQQFRSQYRATFGSNSPRACLADFVQFSQIVVPKVVALYAAGCAYRVRELFVANYLRDDERSQGYRMICHSFEFDPIGRSGPDKYTPDPTIPDLWTHPSLSPVLTSVSDQDRQMAEAARSTFVASLPARSALDVTALLDNDHTLAEQLQADAEQYRNWWEDL